MHSIGFALWRALVLADRYAGISRRVPDTSNRILMYHSVGGGLWDHVSVERFRADLRYLTNEYAVVDLPAVLDPGSDEKRVAITFDDGYCDFYEHALPVLREFDAPATVFVIARTLDDSAFVHDDVMDYEYMTPEQVREVADSDIVTVGNHTATHPRLADIKTDAEREAEILGAKRRLEDHLGVSVDRFCYPYGSFDDEAVEVVRDSHACAVRADGLGELIASDTDPCLLPRINGAVDPARFEWQLTDLSGRLVSLR